MDFCTIIDESKINEQIDNIIDIILKIGFLFIILSIIFSVLVSGSIVRPVQMLKNNMIRVSAGDLESYYISNTNDEISMLGMYFNEMLDNIKSLIDRVYKVEKQKREIELEVLQSQIKPHFLYNTLDTIQWKAIEQANYSVADLIGNLSGFFRISLSDGKEFISIADELKQVEYYLEIQKVRYSNKIDYEFMLDEGILDYKIPKLLIQPLVENSIYHGLKMKATRGYISIAIYEKEGLLEIKVEDNGVGMSIKRLEEVNNNLKKRIQSSNYGLYNLNERLNIYFGDRSKVEIYSEEEIGTTIVIEIPKRKRIMFRLVIADNEETIRNGLKNLIESYDLDLKVVGIGENGLEVLDLIREFSPEILLIDINMPHLNGLEAIEKIRRDRKEMKIIIISGYGEFSYAQKALELGVYSYLLKPIDYKNFKRVLEDAMEDYTKRLWEINKLKDEDKGSNLDVIEYIKTNFTSKDFSLKRASDQLFLSSSYISKKVKEKTGENFTDYVGKLRLELASSLLINKDLEYSIKDISDTVGYSTQHYFSRAFKNHTGLSPIQYKNKYRGD